MLVKRADLVRGHERLRQAVIQPACGIYGPGSHNWRLNRETINFIGGGRAILMQLAHPYVAYGVDQHSATRTDARGRFRRTFRQIFALSFGDLDSAMSAAEQVFEVHTRVHGSIDRALGRYQAGHRYQANDAAALFWVHATLVDTVIAVQSRLAGPLEPAEIEGYYQESKRFAYLFGIPDSEIPADYAAFASYMHRMVHSDALAVGSVARELGEFVLAAPLRGLGLPAAWYRTVTAGLLPEPLRRGYRFRYGPAERALFATTARLLAPTMRRLPRQLRYLPGYLAAEARLGMGPRGPLGKAADRIAMHGLGLWPPVGT